MIIPVTLSDDSEDNLGRDRADDASDGDICATNVDDACESDMQDSAVPAKYHFKTSHLRRLFRQYDWYSYDESTCMSWCLACAWSPSSCGKCKLKDGVLIDSDHISSRLKKHGGESNHIKAYNNWDPRYGYPAGLLGPSRAEQAAGSRAISKLLRLFLCLATPVLSAGFHCKTA